MKNSEFSVRHFAASDEAEAMASFIEWQEKVQKGEHMYVSVSSVLGVLSGPGAVLLHKDVVIAHGFFNMVDWFRRKR